MNVILRIQPYNTANKLVHKHKPKLPTTHTFEWNKNNFFITSHETYKQVPVNFPGIIGQVSAGFRWKKIN